MVVQFRTLHTSEEAAVWFAGSPTILRDGVDLFPTNGHTSDLACRIYRTETGFAGAPFLAQLEEALHA